MPKVHIVEDDAEISELLSTYLERRDFTCFVSGSAENARNFKPSEFDIFIVDIMLPGQNGLDFCQWVRRTSDVPLIILSAEKGDAKRIHGIETGADDYIEKPFNPRELLARISALLRRSAATYRAPSAGKVGFSGWLLDRTRQKLHGPDAIHLPLSSTEYQLLSALIAAIPEPVSREEIARNILNVDLSPEDRRVDILVSRLRKKIATLQPSADFIRTVRTRGYQFCADIQDVD